MTETGVTQRNEKDVEPLYVEMHPPLTDGEALIEADRCYFCFDAPCTIACPTDIDIPGFIQKIRSRNRRGSAETILEANIMGGMCARVCPTEELCEQVCVRNTQEDRPVAIGLLQRYATDPVIQDNDQLFDRAASSGRHIAVIGAGPAGLACAHRLAMLGHRVTVFEARPKPGGLNEYGIAAYKTVDGFAQKEVDYILGIGGIELKAGVLGDDLQLESLRRDFDAVFLGFGLGGVNSLADRLPEAEPAVKFIEQIRQAEDLSALDIGRQVVVIGGGMTAIDIAVQSKKLGVETVTLAYRRGPEAMKASDFEQRFAQTCGVLIRHWLSPEAVETQDGQVRGVVFRRSRTDGNASNAGEETVTVPADQVFLAIGQKVDWDQLDGVSQTLDIEHGRIRIDDHRRTSLENVWAGGDCAVGGDDLTVTAVQDGKVAAHAIDSYLRQTQRN